MWTQNGKSIRESKSSHFMPDTSIHYTSTVCLYYILIFNVMSKICMICPSMPTASNYIYLPPIWSLGCFWGAKFGTENAASPTIHNGFRSPVEIPGNFFGGYAKWSHDWTKKKRHRSPYVWSPWGNPWKPMGNSNRLTEAWRRRWEHSQIWSRTLASHLVMLWGKLKLSPQNFIGLNMYLQWICVSLNGMLVRLGVLSWR